MRGTLLIFIITFISSYSGFALTGFPSDMLLGKTYQQRYFYIELITDKYLPQEDSTTFFNRINELKQLAEQYNERELATEAEVLKLAYFTHHRSDSVYYLKALERLTNLAIEENNKVLMARLSKLAGDYFWGKNYELSFEYLQSEYDIIKSLTADEYPGKQKSLYYLGLKYWEFHDYTKAIKILTEACETDIFGQSLYYTLQSTNTVGLCYQKMGNLDSADYYFMRANAIAVTVGNDAWDGITSGNLGYDYFLRGKINEAAPLLEKDLMLSMKREDWGCASGSLMTLAEINLLRGKTALAAEQVEQARQWVELSEQYPRYKNLYPIYAKLNEQQGRKDYAQLYLDSARLVNDSLARKFSNLQTLRWKHKTELQQQREAAALREKITNILTIFIVVIAMAIIIYSVLHITTQLRRNLLQS